MFSSTVFICNYYNMYLHFCQQGNWERCLIFYNYAYLRENMREYRILPDAEMEAQNIFRDRVREISLAKAEERGEPLKAFVQTFGCQQNEADSEKIAGMCCSMGYEICYTPEEADLIMVNTCAVREHAE